MFQPRLNGSRDGGVETVFVQRGAHFRDCGNGTGQVCAVVDRNFETTTLCQEIAASTGHNDGAIRSSRDGQRTFGRERHDERNGCSYRRKHGANDAAEFYGVEFYHVVERGTGRRGCIFCVDNHADSCMLTR